MIPRLLPLALCGLAACSVGVVPRDVPPPEPADVPETTIRPEPEPTDATPAPTPPPADYRLDGNRLELPSPVAFQTGGDVLTPESDPALEHVRGYLTAKDYITQMRVEGHAEDQTLSEKRAVAAARWLVAHGVDCKRLIAVGFGPNKPAHDASTPDGRARNNRVEFHNAALRDRPIGGQPVDGGGKVAAADLCH